MAIITMKNEAGRRKATVDDGRVVLWKRSPKGHRSDMVCPPIVCESNDEAILAAADWVQKGNMPMIKTVQTWETHRV